MKKLLLAIPFLALIVYATPPPSQSLGKVSVKSITFPDSTVLTSTASIGGGASGNSVYPATATIIAPFGFDASTITVSTMTIGDVQIASSFDNSDSVPMNTLVIRPSQPNQKSMRILWSSGQTAFQVDSENLRVCVACNNPTKTVTLGGNVEATGTIIGDSGIGAPTAGGIFAFQGKATMVNGSAVVANGIIDSTWYVYLTIASPSGTLGSVYISSFTANTSFNIASTSALDNSTVAWIMMATH